jgi:hypothetical protein
VKDNEVAHSWTVASGPGTSAPYHGARSQGADRAERREVDRRRDSPLVASSRRRRTGIDSVIRRPEGEPTGVGHARGMGTPAGTGASAPAPGALALLAGLCQKQTTERALAARPARAEPTDVSLEFASLLGPSGLEGQAARSEGQSHQRFSSPCCVRRPDNEETSTRTAGRAPETSRAKRLELVAPETSRAKRLELVAQQSFR